MKKKPPRKAIAAWMIEDALWARDVRSWEIAATTRGKQNWMIGAPKKRTATRCWIVFERPGK